MAAAPLAAAGKTIIDTHIHLFDPAKFPYHTSGTYQPPAAPLEPYLAFAAQAGITHTIIVHPEPYQDDHRYLAHCFANERPKGFFKGTILLDPIAAGTPRRMHELVKQHSGRIVAMRIHAMNPPGKAPSKSGPIKDRDLRDPAMKATWKAAADLGIAIQMHFLPHHSPEIGALCAQFRDLPVILDHMGRVGMGKPEDLDKLMALAKYPRVYFKFSGVRYSSKQAAPHADAKPIVERAVREFGAGRLLWGGLGHNMEEHRAAVKLFDAMFDRLTEADRDKIRGLNARQLFRFA
jgi:predicted TIM-barrel fold metal-dependent hydrolase